MLTLLIVLGFVIFVVGPFFAIALGRAASKKMPPMDQTRNSYS